MYGRIEVRFFSYTYPVISHWLERLSCAHVTALATLLKTNCRRARGSICGFYSTHLIYSRGWQPLSIKGQQSIPWGLQALRSPAPPRLCQQIMRPANQGSGPVARRGGPRSPLDVSTPVSELIELTVCACTHTCTLPCFRTVLCVTLQSVFCNGG